MLFEEQVARKPNLYPWTQDIINAMWAGFWTPNEFNFTDDFVQFKTILTDQEREIIIRNLSCIGQIEVAVKTFWANLGVNLPHPSMSDLGYVLSNQEVIHNIAYEKLLDVLMLQDVFEKNLKEPVVIGRVEYLKKHMQPVYFDKDGNETDEIARRKQYIYSIILFTLFVENVSLFSQFYVIRWFNRFREVIGDDTQKLLKDTSQQVQYTRNEELLHAKTGIYIINTLRKEYPELFDDELTARIQKECQDALKAENAIIDWIIGDYAAKNISADILKEYIRSRMDESLKEIGFPVTSNEPFVYADQYQWAVEEVNGGTIVDFFNKRPVDYAKKNRVVTKNSLFKNRKNAG